VIVIVIVIKVVSVMPQHNITGYRKLYEPVSQRQAKHIITTV